MTCPWIGNSRATCLDKLAHGIQSDIRSGLGGGSGSQLAHITSDSCWPQASCLSRCASSTHGFPGIRGVRSLSGEAAASLSHPHRGLGYLLCHPGHSDRRPREDLTLSGGEPCLQLAAHGCQDWVPPGSQQCLLPSIPCHPAPAQVCGHVHHAHRPLHLA